MKGDRQDLIRRLRKCRRESEQLVRDIQWWNEYRTDAAPLDCGADLCRAALAKKAIDLLRKGGDPSAILTQMAEEKSP